MPECEVYDAGMLETLRWLLDKGHLAQPYHVQFVLGVPGGMSGTERNLRFLVEGLPEAAHWSVAGHRPLRDAHGRGGAALGGHVRVGLEDNLYVSKGVLAQGNHELVAAAARMVPPRPRAGDAFRGSPDSRDAPARRVMASRRTFDSMRYFPGGSA